MGNGVKVLDHKSMSKDLKYVVKEFKKVNKNVVRKANDLRTQLVQRIKTR